MLGVLNKIFGSKHEKDVRALQPLAEEINALCVEYGKLSDEELRAKTVEFRSRILESLKETDEPPAGVFDRRERLRKQLFKLLGCDLVPFLLEAGNFIHEMFPYWGLSVLLQFRTFHGQRLIGLLQRLQYAGAEFNCLRTEFFV